MDLKRIEDLLALLAARDVSEFQYKDGDVSLKLRLGPPPAIAAPMVHAPMTHAPLPVSTATVQSAPPREAAPAAAPAKDPNVVTVESPMVGTFYRSPSPGAAAFVEVGDRVKAGQTLCIVEAMKLMNEIETEVAGTVAAILVDTAQPVQFGQALFTIRRD